MLDYNEIKKLVRLLENSQINEIEINDRGRKIRLTKSAPGNGQQMGMMLPAGFYHGSAPAAPAPSAPEAAAAAAPAAGRNTRQVKSPMVGTFYTSPSPDADPYVQVGDMVHKGQVLCIVEAMKLMNEIESEFAGRIVEVLVENAQPVEFDQPLFTLEVTG
ncbi:MAG: acetyl-CoA carboxylase biotin carboxyl carrier protein [Candidatus Zixiibacteriota bacterium]|nr:MAG: acetyl-CoA carboxylase biotin carboxyl carrier protein [candidate division Zixibacteria bacterium]